MNITVNHLPESQIVESMGKRTKFTYPNGMPISVRCVWHCNNCKTEVGGYFGNKVYGHKDVGLCNDCFENQDPIVQLCVAQTGMTPVEYQRRHGIAWNE